MRTRQLTDRTVRRGFLGLIALLGLVLCSCSSEEETSSSLSGSDGCLTFNVSADGYGNTRGIPMNSLFGRAGLLGYAYDKEFGWGNGHAPEMMYNEVMQGSGTTWQTSKTYVPDALKTMRFYAYYPYQAYVNVEEDEYGNEILPLDDENNEVKVYIRMSAEDEIGIPYFDYISPLTADDQFDLMYAVSDEVNVNSQTGKLDPVTLQFHHLLSAVTFTVKNGFDNGYIKSISIDNVCYMGQFSYHTKTWTVEEDVEEISQDIEVKVTTGNETIKPLLSDKQYFMILPQTLNENSELKVVFNNGVKDYPLTFALGQATVGGDPIEFKIGKITTFSITVESLTKMSLKCSVTDWGHGATFNGADSDFPDVILNSDIDSWMPDLGLDANNDTIIHEVVTGPQN